MTKRPIAIQLYTLRNEIESDYSGVLRAVAELGYGAVELCTLGAFSAAELHKEIAGLGLEVAAMHSRLDRLERQLDAVIAEAQALNCKNIVCPWLPPERRSLASFQALPGALNQIGRACQDQGLQLSYHNHDFEFQRFGDRRGLDILLDGTDPALVKIELDVYWAAFTGTDPVALLNALAGRVLIVHLKDMSADATRDFAEVGHGVLDMPAILAAADAANVEWYIVEQDRCARPPLESIGMSLAYLRSLGRV